MLFKTIRTQRKQKGRFVDMELMNKMWKDPGTGKIYQQAGGQEPVEIDENFARILHLDIDSIPVLGKKDESKVICSNCGSIVLKRKFCTECGAPIPVGSESVPAPAPAAAPPEQKPGFFPTPDNLLVANAGSGGIIMTPSDPNEIPEGPQPVDDAGLTVLGGYCKKTMATVGGDGYDEIVLYKNDKDGSLQIHTYSKYAYMQKEIHHSFKAKEGVYEALLSLTDKLHLDEYEGKRGISLCGGMYICKYREDGVLHVVTTDNLGTDGPSIIIQIGNLLGNFKGEETTR